MFLNLKTKIIENKNLFLITKEVGFIYSIKKSKFGELYSEPNIKDFFNFINQPAFLIGPEIYNQLGLSTQIPNQVQYLTNKKVSFIYSKWRNQIKVSVSEDLDIFKKFSQEEYSIIDALVNFDKIAYDGYFNNQKDLINEILLKAKENSLNLEKLITYSISKNKELINYLPKSEVP